GHRPGTSRPGAGTKPRGAAFRVGVGAGFASPSTLHSGVTSARVLYRARRGEKAPANPRICRCVSGSTLRTVCRNPGENALTSSISVAKYRNWVDTLVGYCVVAMIVQPLFLA